MQKISTQLQSEKPTLQSTLRKPKKATVDFIKQFARGYKFNSMMPSDLGSLVLN